MPDMSEAKPPKGQKQKPVASGRAARLAEALKANLKRRKAAQKQGDKD
jgi:predicted secreted protein